MKPSRLLWSALGCCVLLAVTTPAQHQDYEKSTTPPPPAKGERPAAVPLHDQVITDATRFKALDTDGDNRISRTEFTVAPNLQLPTGGTPGATGAGEGRLSESRIAAGKTDSNFTSGPKANAVEWFNRIDLDKDGFLSRAELGIHPGNRPP